jgi:hypothetical protein
MRGRKPKSMYYVRYSLCPRKLKWYADNFEDSQDNWIEAYVEQKGGRLYVKHYNPTALLGNATYCQKTIAQYDNTLRLNLDYLKQVTRSEIMGVLEKHCGNHRPKLIFEDLIIYGFMIKRSNGEYFLQ